MFGTNLDFLCACVVFLSGKWLAFQVVKFVKISISSESDPRTIQTVVDVQDDPSCPISKSLPVARVTKDVLPAPVIPKTARRITTTSDILNGGGCCRPSVICENVVRSRRVRYKIKRS
jgi:hypothetical protein